MNRSSTIHAAPWRTPLLGLCLFSFVLFAFACAKQRQPSRFLIPKDFVGWVLIELDVKGAPFPRQEEGHLIFAIPPSGKLAMAGAPQTGWAKDEYFYVDAQGVMGPLRITPPGGGGWIWGEGSASFEDSSGTKLSMEHFFVGSELEFQRAPKLEELMRSKVSEPQTR
ncbi:MAG: hypothetical protein ABI639_10975 [Thermoanaerobaculia bacterium]